MMEILICFLIAIAIFALWVGILTLLIKWKYGGLILGIILIALVLFGLTMAVNVYLVNQYIQKYIFILKLGGKYMNIYEGRQAFKEEYKIEELLKE